jgi:hypothetical protein
MRGSAGSVDDVWAEVVGRLRARRGELVDAIFARVRGDAFGPVGAGDAEYVAGLRAAVAVALDYVLEGIERGEEWAGPIPVAASEQARRAARIGVPLDTVLRRYMAGQAVLGDYILREAERVDRDDVPREMLRVQASLVDRLAREVSRAHSGELERVARSREQRLSELVRALLAGGEGMDGVEGLTMDGVERELGYELDAEHIGVIARGPGAREAVSELAARLNRRSLCVANGQGTVWAWLGGQGGLEMLELARAVSAQAQGRGAHGSGEPAVDVHFAVGEPARGLGGWRLTHQQAQSALVVALRRGGREGVTLTRYGDVALLAIALKDQPLARALIDIYVAPLDEQRDGGAVLRKTLRAYLETECSVSSAAAALGVTRKTVASRLHTIEERLGLSLHPCPAEFEIALLLHDLGAPAEISISE